MASLKMSTDFTFDAHPANQVTNTMLEQAASLFSSAYGVWSPGAEQKMGKHYKLGFSTKPHHLALYLLMRLQGTRIKMSAERLRKHYISSDTNSVLVRCMAGDELVGYAIATRWIYKGPQICWVTQLCVRPGYRRKGLATAVRASKCLFATTILLIMSRFYGACARAKMTGALVSCRLIPLLSWLFCVPVTRALKMLALISLGRLARALWLRRRSSM